MTDDNSDDYDEDIYDEEDDINWEAEYYEEHLEK